MDIPAKGIQFLHDEGQRTAVVIELFETADDMAAAEGPLDKIDPGDTPGTRASIDRCEIKAELGTDKHRRAARSACACRHGASLRAKGVSGLLPCREGFHGRGRLSAGRGRPAERRRVGPRARSTRPRCDRRPSPIPPGDGQPR